ncbi:MAG TPA: sigma-70 family RNA polymerase sigma factor, partial [Terriglobales bacterium]|nr:sigma-70 family RNA polymerase sigma factor [Terriglobales bacterium]
DAAGIDAERLDVVSQGFFCVSLDSPTSEDEDRSLADILPCPASDPEREQNAADLSERLDAALARLPSREAEILRLRFGTSRRPARTLEEVGQILGVSRERVRQLEARALRQLMPICQSQGLRSYID